MRVYITHQKAAAIAKKSGVSLPEKGEKVLVGRLGHKLGKSWDGLMGRFYYVRLYGGDFSIANGRKEFNI